MISLKELVSKRKQAENDDRTLRVDCRMCGNEPDLGSVGCIRCLCGFIEREGEPESIMLRCGSEVRIDRRTVNVLNRLSADFLSDRIGSTDPKCGGCILTQQMLEKEKWFDVSTENLNEIIEKLGNVYVDCPHGFECAMKARNSFIDLRDKVDKITHDAAKDAFRMIGV